MKLQHVLPGDIEKRSFEIIEQELPHPLDPLHASIIKRVIHTTADFEFTDTLYFSKNAVGSALSALKNGATIVTDTTMTLAGINKSTLEKLDCKALCFVSNEDVANIAELNKTTKSGAATIINALLYKITR
jgi:precorrin-8X/cobalt-precorrin-8 methylmutase